MLRMNKNEIGAVYEISTDERNELKKEIINLLEDYDYNPTSYGVEKELDTWIKNKGWIINLFKKHPNYNGKYQIVFDSDYTRVCDSNAIKYFTNWLSGKCTVLLREYKIGAFTFNEIENISYKMDDIAAYMRSICNKGYDVRVNGRTYNEYAIEKERWSKKYNDYIIARNEGKCVICGNSAYTYESHKSYMNIDTFASIIRSNKEPLATEEFAARVNELFPNAKAVKGQKVSRIVNKVCVLVGMDKHPDYNKEFAKFADGINPLVIKRHTILSVHPVDYLTMSFGNSWASCHTIDKSNKRGMPDDYSGCYSSGTLSYMLDGASFVYYTVDKEYNGNCYELEPKINRNMFHIGEDKVIQARVYPQANDSDTGIYRQIREIAQKVVADCLDVPNLWKNVKGTGECYEVTRNIGTHYQDILKFSDCNVSYLKDDDDMFNKVKICIGHNPICPNCGDMHEWEECIECRDCYEDQKECYDCGCHYDADDMHRIDGRWYCEECCFYCDYHEEYEAGSYTYVEGYGRVCEDGLDGDYFYCCEHCSEWYFDDGYGDGITTEDGTHFCCCDCAENDGYSQTNSGEWYPDDEVRYCDHCDCTVHEDDWNSEFECCNDCVDEVRAEREEEVA